MFVIGFIVSLNKKKKSFEPLYHLSIGHHTTSYELKTEQPSVLCFDQRQENA